jgi:hypothetical protein
MLSFLDMKVHAVGAGLRWFGLALGFAYFGLIFATVFAAPTSFILLFGQSDVEIPVTLEPPLEVELAGGRIVVLGEQRTTEYRGFGGREEEAIPNRVSVRAQVPVQKGDRDTRIALGAALVATLAVAWIGLTALDGSCAPPGRENHSTERTCVACDGSRPRSRPGLSSRV